MATEPAADPPVELHPSVYEPRSLVLGIGWDLRSGVAPETHPDRLGERYSPDDVADLAVALEPDVAEHDDIGVGGSGQ